MGRPSLATWLCGKWWTPNITDYSPNKEEIQICSENCPCWHHLHFFPSLRGLPTLLGIMLGIKNAIIKKAWSLSMRRRQDKGIANSPGLGVEHFCLLIPAHLIDLVFAGQRKANATEEKLTWAFCLEICVHITCTPCVSYK